MMPRAEKCYVMLFLLLASIGPLNAHAAAYETARMSKWEEKAVEEAKKRYPEAEVRLTKVWDRKRADEAVKQYHVTLSEGNKKFRSICYNFI